MMFMHNHFHLAAGVSAALLNPVVYICIVSVLVRIHSPCVANRHIFAIILEWKLDHSPEMCALC